MKSRKSRKFFAGFLLECAFQSFFLSFQHFIEISYTEIFQFTECRNL